MTDALVGLGLGLMVAVISWGVTNSIWKSETVNRGFAAYCPDDGQWAWNGECDE